MATKKASSFFFSIILFSALSPAAVHALTDKMAPNPATALTYNGTVTDTNSITTVASNAGSLISDQYYAKTNASDFQTTLHTGTAASDVFQRTDFTINSSYVINSVFVKVQTNTSAATDVLAFGFWDFTAGSEGWVQANGTTGGTARWDGNFNITDANVTKFIASNNTVKLMIRAGTWTGAGTNAANLLVDLENITIGYNIKYTGSASQSMSVTDSLSKQSAFSRSSIQSIASVQNIDRQSLSLRETSQNPALSQSADAYKSVSSEASSPLSLSVTSAEVFTTRITSIVQSLSLSNFVERLATLSQDISQSLALSNFVEGFATRLTNISQSMAFSNFTTALSIFARIVSDAISSIDSSGSLATLLKEVSDSLSMDSTAGRLSSFLQSASLPIILSHISEAASSLSIYISEGMSLLEYMTTVIVQSGQSFLAEVSQALASFLDAAGNFIQEAVQNPQQAAGGGFIQDLISPLESLFPISTGADIGPLLLFIGLPLLKLVQLMHRGISSIITRRRMSASFAGA